MTMAARSTFALVLLLAATPVRATGDTEAQFKIITLAGPQSVVFSPDGKWLAAGTTDGSLRIWESATGNQLHTLAAHAKFVRGLAVSRDGRWLATGGGDNLIKLWEVATAREVRTFEGHTGPVQAVAFSPDGSRLASGGQDATLRVWEVDTGRQLLSVPATGSFNNLHALAFSPDGASIASGLIVAGGR